MRKKLEGVSMSGASPIVIMAASMTCAVVVDTPAIIASASPAFTMRPA
jgi:hypothetical protein